MLNGVVLLPEPVLIKEVTIGVLGTPDKRYAFAPLPKAPACVPPTAAVKAGEPTANWKTLSPVVL